MPHLGDGLLMVHRDSTNDSVDHPKELDLPHRNFAQGLSANGTSGFIGRFSPRSATVMCMKELKQSADWTAFQQFGVLVGFLLLITAMAVLAAVDAKRQCLSHHMYFMLNFADDDSVEDMDETAILDGQLDCVELFQQVVVPVGAISLGLGAISMILIARFLRRLEQYDKITDTFPSKFPILLALVTIQMVVLACWVYWISIIILRPKQQSNDDDEDGQNPYTSLAAVDLLGNVGDNANLYYLSWIALAVSLGLLYNLSIDCFRNLRNHLRTNLQQQHYMMQATNIVSTTIRSPSISMNPSLLNLTTQFVQRRKKWYHVMIRLRVRTGYWMAALCSSLVTFLSASHVYESLFLHLGENADDDDEDDNQTANFLLNNGPIDVCSQLTDSDDYTFAFCNRTYLAALTGGSTSLACVIAIGLHLFERRRFANQVDRSGSVTSQGNSGHATCLLWGEFLLSVSLSVVVGFNALYSSAVEGPAAKVGNMYYSSWISLMLCLRVCLGCLEEIYAVEAHAQNQPQPPKTISEYYENQSNANTATFNKSVSASASMSVAATESGSQDVPKDYTSERVPRLRRYFALAMFSSICAASTFDAAQFEKDALTLQHRYTMIAPIVVASISSILFICCLKKQMYTIVARFYIGGVLSLLCSGLFMGDLILTMHSDISWAVNGIGEIKSANLYYFTWSSIVTAGLQMMSYMRPLLGHEEEDTMVLVWGAMGKVSFVLLGAATHIWYNISSNCQERESQGSILTFCARTMFALGVGTIGTATSGLVLSVRFLNLLASRPKLYNRFQGGLALFLVLLFTVAAALITGIGGPGQSVGDLYYSTWLGFCASLAILASCYSETYKQEMGPDLEKYKEFFDGIR